MQRLRLLITFVSVCIAASIASQYAASQTLETLHNFNPNGTGGLWPMASLITDAAGNLYGTTQYGGYEDAGTVFELTRQPDGHWAEKLLHNFSKLGVDGSQPVASLVFDSAGNLYGTTEFGGTTGACFQNPNFPPGCGVVFRLTPQGDGTWKESIIHHFSPSTTDGQIPISSLVMDTAGNLYGTTYLGGSGGSGTVFELSPVNGRWQEKILHAFSGQDGTYPLANVVLDSAGNLYGTTFSGGAYGWGNAFELSPSTDGKWRAKVLHDFGYDYTDGVEPRAGMTFDAAGHLYGTTSNGGTACNHRYSCGTVFELTPAADGTWSEKILHNFASYLRDGYEPDANLAMDSAGNIYGTTHYGGSGPCFDQYRQIYGCGSVFELTRASDGSFKEKVIHGLNGYTESAFEVGFVGIVLDSSGTIYGTSAGASAIGRGSAFTLTQQPDGGWKNSVIHRFGFMKPDGAVPYSGGWPGL